MKKTFKTGIAAAMCGLGLVAGLVPAAAFADNTGTTDVKVQTDPASTQLSFEVPTLIQFGVDSAGTLTGPSPEVLMPIRRTHSISRLTVTRLRLVRLTCPLMLPSISVMLVLLRSPML